MSESDTLRVGRVFDARLHVLDRQVLDPHGVPVTAVDDIELTAVPQGEIPDSAEPPVIVNLLGGALLATRLFGGRPPESRWMRIAWNHLTELGAAIRLNAPGESLDVTWTERWVRDRVIGRIPGGRHDPE